MEKKWVSYYDNLTKPSANWDRSAKRQVVSAPQPTAKTKSKPKKPKPKEEKVDPFADEPEVVFVTPPLTPPAPPPYQEEASNEFKKDDEFWKFFDQPIPS